MTTPGEPLGAFKTPLGALEANIILTGLEAAAAARIVWVILAGDSLLPSFPSEWAWTYAVWALFGLLGVFILGLAVEALAGLAEIVLTRRWCGLSWSGLSKYLGGNPELLDWYKDLVHQPADWRSAQRWIWKSSQASDEFARRRVRLLVGRNTAFIAFVSTATTAVGLLVSRPTQWWRLAGVLGVGVLLMLLFGWVWISAHQGWNRAVEDASDIGPP